MRCIVVLLALFTLHFQLSAQTPTWGNYNGNPQHTGISTVPLQDLNVIKWSTPVDLQPQYTGGGSLLVHYGSPLATAANTIVVPVKVGATDTFRVEGRYGYDGSLKWTQTTDYILPTHDWTPSYTPTITPQNRLYFAGAGGTVFYRDAVDSNTTVATPNRLAFYGDSNYAASSAAAASNVFINTPITSDASGNIYFGFQVNATVTLGGAGGVTLQAGGGIAKITPAGVGTYVQASTAAGDAAINKVVHNAAPAISTDGSKVYAAVTTNTGTGFGTGYLVSLNSSDLSPINKVALQDVNNSANKAYLPEQGSASPMVAPNGDVYFGVLDNPSPAGARYHGWMLHFNAALDTTLLPSRFGWDNTASIIATSLVPSYSGSSPYLILTKYNNYVSTGGDGKNRLGIFDPFDSELDPIYNKPVAKEILSILGPTPDGEYPGVPGAVREWCINSAAVDPFSKTILVNNEDGKSYVWDLTTNTLKDAVTLTTGIGEAYTPTLIGPDGTGYAINNGILFAMSATAVPEPSSLLLLVVVVVAGAAWSWRQYQVSNKWYRGHP